MNAPLPLDAFWMPFTPNRQFKAQPRLVVSAEGVCYRTEDGREVLDGTSGLWCVGAGHRHPRIVEAVTAAGPGTVVHIGCDPAAFARDVGLYLGQGYRLEQVRAFDAFPLTHHMECIALLVR